jgi:WD40 repeat protein
MKKHIITLFASTLLLAGCGRVPREGSNSAKPSPTKTLSPTFPPTPDVGELVGWRPPFLLYDGTHIAPDGKTFCTVWGQSPKGRGPDRHFAQLCETATGETLDRLPTISQLSWVGPFHPNSKCLIILDPADRKGPVLWDWLNKKDICMFERDVEKPRAPAAFSPDAAFIFGSAADNSVTQWDAVTGKIVRELDLPKKPISPEFFGKVFFSEDGKRVIRVAPFSINMWDIAIGRPSGPDFPEYEPAQRKNEHPPLCCSQSRRYLCTGRNLYRGNPGVRLWDLNQGKLLKEFNFPGDSECRVQGASFTDDDRTLLAVSSDRGDLHAWDVATGKHLWHMHIEDYTHLAVFSSDGRLLLTGWSNSSMALTDTRERKQLWSRTLGCPGSERA